MFVLLAEIKLTGLSCLESQPKNAVVYIGMK